MARCSYMTDSGICRAFSDDEFQEPCVEGPCPYDNSDEAAGEVRSSELFLGVECENCGKTLTWSHAGKQLMMRWSRERGWSVSRKDRQDICYCPECRKKKKARRGKM